MSDSPSGPAPWHGHVPFVCRSPPIAPQDLRTDRAPYYSSCPQQVESNAPASRPNATMRTDGCAGFVGGWVEETHLHDGSSWNSFRKTAKKHEALRQG